MVARPHYYSPTHRRAISSVCRFLCRTIHILSILTQMKKIKQIIRFINMIVVNIILTAVYFVIILPYRLFIKKPSANWITGKSIQTTLDRMW